MISLVVARTTPVAAADPGVARAQQLKKQGDAAMDSLHYDEALEKYQAAYDLRHDPAILYNMAQVRRARSEYAQALDALEQFDHDAPAELRARVPKLDELLDELRAKVVTVTVHCNVEGAKVTAQGRAVGVTPIAAPLRLNPGPANVTVEREGYEPWKSDATLASGATTTLDAALREKDTRSLLLLKSGSVVARVFVDGQRSGSTPTTQAVSPGSHSVMLSADGYEDTEMQVVVRAGEHKELDMPLKVGGAFYTRWWFWTGVGAVVVVGGVVIAATALSSKGPDSGDGFQPSRFTAPASYLFHF